MPRSDGIRGARAEDRATIRALTVQLGYEATEQEIGRRLAAIEAGGDGEVLVIEAGGRVFGWVHVLESRRLESGRFAEVGGLVVDERHRGGGAGTRLLEAAERWARARGHDRLRVRSNVVRKDAHRFYERLGYRCSKTQSNFVKRLDPAQ